MDTEQLSRQISLLRRLVEEANHRLQQVTADIRLLRGGIDLAAQASGQLVPDAKIGSDRTPTPPLAQEVQAQEVSQ